MSDHSSTVPANDWEAERERLKTLGLAVVNTEAQAVACLASRIDDGFANACRYLLHCKGRVVVTGMGKSGHIGSKIAATLASTGTPSFFVHPGEASHGDLGMITPNDVVIALSNSGETQEILTILPMIRRQGVPMISLTGNPASTLARGASVNIDVGVDKEACPLGLAPTSSTTVALVMGDALAIALLEARGFTAEDFARSHPAGSLGRRLLLLVDDVMHTGDAIPSVLEDAQLTEVLMEMTGKGLGMTLIHNDAGLVTGIYTDGDLRRTLDHGTDLRKTAIRECMTSDFRSGSAGILAAEALRLMQTHKFSSLPVLDDEGRAVGALNMHDLLRAGVV